MRKDYLLGALATASIFMACPVRAAGIYNPLAPIAFSGFGDVYSEQFTEDGSQVISHRKDTFNISGPGSYALNIPYADHSGGAYLSASIAASPVPVISVRANAYGPNPNFNGDAGYDISIYADYQIEFVGNPGDVDVNVKASLAGITNGGIEGPHDRFTDDPFYYLSISDPVNGTLLYYDDTTPPLKYQAQNIDGYFVFQANTVYDVEMHLEAEGASLYYEGDDYPVSQSHFDLDPQFSINSAVSPGYSILLSPGAGNGSVVSPVPLPASAPMFGAALLGLAGVSYAAKRKKAAAAA